MINYPLRFEPILQDKIWGGEKLSKMLHKKSPSKTTGESWEISEVDGNISTVVNGNMKGKNLSELIKQEGASLIGEENLERFEGRFPLLIKYIDAKEALSVQLHPNDELAAKRHNSKGKTEMWYIMQADEKANINVGFNRSVSKDEYLEHLENGKITEILNFEDVTGGDCFMINSGKIHAIGAGVLLAEIQQTSDVTYRVYDWDRKDAKGKGRELHTEEAIDALDYDKKDDYVLDYKSDTNVVNPVIRHTYFKTSFLNVEKEMERNLKTIDSFLIYMCVEGEGAVCINEKKETISFGQTLLIPANTDYADLSTETGMKLLEVYV